MNGEAKLSINGILRALSPIVHGEPPEEGSSRTYQTKFRRIPYIMPDGRIVEMPVISGNGIIGSNRRKFVTRTLYVIDAFDSLDPHTAYFLLAGGATQKEEASIGGPEFREDVRNNLPFVDLLGGSLYACFFSGRIRVDFAVPVCKENYTDVPVPEAVDENELPSFDDLSAAMSLKPARFTRFDDGTFKAEELESEQKNRKSSARSIYAAEVMPPNTVLSHGFSLLMPVREETQNAFWAFVDTFVSYGEVGGWAIKGMGKVKAQYYFEGRPISDEELKDKAKRYWDYLSENKDDLKKYLKNLSETARKMAEEAREKKKAAKKKKGGEQEE